MHFSIRPVVPSLLLAAALALGSSLLVGCQKNFQSGRGALVGTVCDASGAPVGSGTILVDTSAGAFEQTSDADGEWTLDGLPAGQAVVVLAAGSDELQLSVEIVAGTETEVIDTRCSTEGTPEPTTPTPDPEPEIIPDATGSLDGCLCDFKNGAWVGFADVNISRGSQSHTATTGADGCFEFNDITIGEWDLVVTHNGFEVTGSFEVFEDQTTTLGTPETCALPEQCEVDATITPDEVPATPVDIILIIDSSGSMDDEIAATQANLNAFSSEIEASGIDHRVIVIGDRGAINIPPPLGTSLNFLHVDQEVGSWNALEVMLQQYTSYRAFLRTDSKKHIVIISDDDSDMSASSFLSFLPGLAGDPFRVAGEDWVMHSIVGYGPTQNGCNGAAARGDVYIELSTLTGGVLAAICGADFSPVFTAIETAVEASAALPCAFQLPPAPEGYVHLVADIDVEYTPASGTAVPMTRVDDLASCTEWGWYLQDDPLLGRSVVSCPSACSALRADGEGSVRVAVLCSEE